MMTNTALAAPLRKDAALLWAAIAVTVLLWASAFVGIRAIADSVSPGALTLGRILIGSFLLTLARVVTVARRRRSGVKSTRTSIPRGRFLLLVLGWGVAWFSVYNLALNNAERHIDAGTAALLVNIAPMITAVLAGLLLGEGFPRRLIAGMLVALTGVAVIALSTSTGQFDVWGVLFGLLAALVYGSAATLQKWLLSHVDAPTMTWLGCVVGTVVCLPFAPELIHALASAPLSSLLAMVYLGVFPTAIAFSTWGYVLARSSAGRTAASTYAVPAVVVMLSWLVLGEMPPLAALLGGALALVGVAVATLRCRP
ncbi:DMT family transporter [Rathayibacter toxicus]|uniref:DMT family transporter n=1 Tax=Rathayibacter toxicus TaxID=145458 RepID=UPI000CE8FA94|nr:DMT family transporter [Rathayibacter toxicus]PPI56017.1 EamA family transporter [Rathayibacter toxicus]QOD10193.1 DMT family transporter [Rathayibacter toxicus]QWL28869.1 DMT family transporter [Rathayibacter toxicus]QWL33056.1 DMT family transporter [Rathayibacter toxicus]QWL35150.1 DMT family transporter [Rathayibacter toxicus]